MLRSGDAGSARPPRPSRVSRGLELCQHFPDGLKEFANMAGAGAMPSRLQLDIRGLAQSI
jgi:hypothetical protein